LVRGKTFLFLVIIVGVAVGVLGNLVYEFVAPRRFWVKLLFGGFSVAVLWFAYLTWELSSFFPNRSVYRLTLTYDEKKLRFSTSVPQIDDFLHWMRYSPPQTMPDTSVKLLNFWDYQDENAKVGEMVTAAFLREIQKQGHLMRAPGQFGP